MDALVRDLRYALRMLLARPGFSALAALTLAAGIGVNTVAFSAVNALLFKPFRFRGAHDLGWIMQRSPGNPYGQFSWPDFQDYARHSRLLAGIAAEGRTAVTLRIGARAEQSWALLISADYLELLGVRPAAGRLFTAADLAGSEIPVVVSQRFWESRLGGREIAGRTLVVNGRLASLVGVLPENFQGPGGLYEPDIWLPLERIDALGMPPELGTRERPWLTLVGRLREDVTVPQAQAELSGLAAQIATRHANPDTPPSVTFHRFSEGHPEIRGLAGAVWIALGMVGLVLLIACFNVAGLLLARASERQREMGIRAALGAGRARLLGQMAIEGTLLATISGALALVLASWSGDLLAAFSLPSPIPQRLHLGVDWRLVAFTALMVSIAGVLPALAPALHAARADVLRALRVEAVVAGRPSRARGVLVVAQVAGSTLFVAAAFLFLRSFWNSAQFDPGFETDRTLVVEVNPRRVGYDPGRARIYFQNLGDRVAGLPGVEAVSLADRAPFYVGFAKTVEVSHDGTDCAAADCTRATLYAVGAAHFAALGVPLTAGRDFTTRDVAAGRGVIVSRNTAERLWPDGNAIGRSLRIGSDGRMVEVIGVAADVKHRSFNEPPGLFLYRPIQTEDFVQPVSLIVRTRGEARFLAAAVEDIILALDPNLPPASVKTMTDRLEIPLWPARTAAGFFAVCGTLALALAAVGLFGVTYYAVNQRTREFGIRLALGATGGGVIRLVIREGLALVLPGLALGLAAALIVSRLAANALYGVSPSDPATYGATALVQAAIGLVACALPAWRASKSDPMLALRTE